jgi:hypothetical protein
MPDSLKADRREVWAEAMEEAYSEKIGVLHRKNRRLLEGGTIYLCL